MAPVTCVERPQELAALGGFFREAWGSQEMSACYGLLFSHCIMVPGRRAWRRRNAGRSVLGKLGRKSFQPGTNRQPAPECKSCEGPSWLRQAAGLWPLLKAQAGAHAAASNSPSPACLPMAYEPEPLSLSHRGMVSRGPPQTRVREAGFSSRLWARGASCPLWIFWKAPSREQ